MSQYIMLAILEDMYQCLHLWTHGKFLCHTRLQQSHRARNDKFKLIMILVKLVEVSERIACRPVALKEGPVVVYSVAVD